MMGFLTGSIDESDSILLGSGHSQVETFADCRYLQVMKIGAHVR